MLRCNAVSTYNLSCSQIQELYVIDCQITEKYGQLKRFRDVDEYRNVFLSMFDGKNNELFILSDDKEAYGILTFTKGADWSGKDQRKLTIRLCETKICPDLAQCLRQLILEKLEAYDRIAITVFNSELDWLITEFSGKAQLRSGVYFLDKGDIDMVALKEIAKIINAKNSDLRVVYTNLITEDYVQQYCDLFNELQGDMPDVTEEAFVQFVISPKKQMAQNELYASRNFAHHCFMIFNANNKMVAMSNVSVNNNDPRFPYQFLVGVSEHYRGRGLGKLMYALMYQQLVNDVDFEKFYVNHHPKNKHAIAISEWIGYKFSYLEATYVV